MNTLLVEDDDVTRTLLSHLLRQRGHAVTACADVPHAVRAMETTHFSLLVCHLELQTSNGLELCRYIRRHETLRRTVICVITANIGAAHDALAAGADDFICKPFERDQLEVRLDIAEWRANELQASEAVRREMRAFRIMQAASRAEDVAGALRCALSIGSLTGWEAGTAWVDAATDSSPEALEAVALWVADASATMEKSNRPPPHVLQAAASRHIVSLQNGGGSRVAVPIVENDRTLAVLEFVSSRPRDVESLVSMIAIHLAQVIARKMQEAQLSFRLRAQEAIAAFSHFALSTTSLDDLMQAAVNHLRCALACDVSVVMRTLWNGRGVLVRTGSGVDAGDLRLDTVSPSQAFYAVTDGHSIMVDDYAHETRFVRPSIFEQSEIRSSVSAVIEGIDEAYGIVVAGSRDAGWFRLDHVPFVETVAHLLSLAVKRAWMSDRMRQNEERLGAVMTSLNDLLAVTDKSGIVMYQGPNFHRLLGYEKDELMQQTFLELVHPDDLRRARRAIARAVRTPGQRVTAELQFRAKSGTYRLFELSGVYLPQRTGINGFLAIARDITDQRASEEALRQTHKLEVLGRLAGSIAHDFNNLLTVINGYSELLSMRYAHDARLVSELAEIVDAGQRAQELTNQLLAFSRKRGARLDGVHPATAFDKVGRLIERMVGENVKVVMSASKTTPLMQCDPHQLEQVLLNLAINARDAMQGKGTLTLEALAETHQCEACPSPVELIALRVRDTGSGMSEEVRTRIFEPFFTTKAENAGTGLGLAIVQTSLAQWGGHVHVDSTEGVGTVFRLYLQPAATRKVGEQPHAHDVDLHRGEAVVLVEDDDAVRRLTARLLRTRGHVVLEARSGEEALALDLRRSNVSLLITDVAMPGIGGVLLARMMRDRDPALRVLYTSGHLPEELRKRDIVDSRDAVLRKPYTAEDLHRAVDAVLGPAPKSTIRID